MRCNFTHITLLTGTMLLLSSVSFAAPSTNEPAKGARLLNSVAADAHQIESASLELQKLTKDSSASWAQYDRQWNEIQPAVETLDMEIARLDAMQSSLSPAEKQALAQSKAEYLKIAQQSRDLGNLVDKVPVDLNSPKFKIESRDLVREANEIAHIVKKGA